MSGVARQRAADLHGIARSIQPVDRIEGQVEGGQDKFIYPDPGGRPMFPTFYAEGESAAPKAFRDDKRACRGTESIGLDGLLGHLFSLRILQPGFAFLPFRDRTRPALQVRLEENGLELYRIARPVSRTVGIEVGIFAVTGFLAAICGLSEIQLFAAAEGAVRFAEAGLQGIVFPVCRQFGRERDRQAGKPVTQGGIPGPGHCLSVFQQDQIGPAYRLAGFGIGHIDFRSPFHLLPGKGKAEMAIPGKGFFFSAVVFDLIRPVIQFRECHFQGILRIETAAGIGQGGGEQGFAAILLIDFYIHRGQVAHIRADFSIIDRAGQRGGLHRGDESVHLATTGGDASFAAAKGFPLRLECLATLQEGLVSRRPGAVTLQLPEIFLKQFRLREERGRLPLFTLSQRLQSSPAPFFFRKGKGFQIVQPGSSRITAIQVFLQ